MYTQKLADLKEEVEFMFLLYKSSRVAYTANEQDQVLHMAFTSNRGRLHFHVNIQFQYKY